MQGGNKKMIVVLISLLSIALSSGCTDWKKEYSALNVKYQNLKGRHDRELADKGQLEEQLTRGQQTIAELQQKIDELKKTPGMGFGDDYDVKYDASKGTVTVTLENTILFNSGEAALKKATSRELDHIQSVLRSQYSGRPIDVVGHTDTDPIKRSGWKDNWELSAERALAVTRYLIERGIPAKSIRAVGCGEARPVASNATASGKAKNRRVEIVVYMR